MHDGRLRHTGQSLVKTVDDDVRPAHTAEFLIDEFEMGSVCLVDDDDEISIK